MTNATARASADAEVQLLTGAADVSRASAAWDALPSTSAAVGGHAWVQAWLEVYGAEHELGVAVAGSVDVPTAVLPLVRNRRSPWTWEMLGVRQVSEPMDVRGYDARGLGLLVEDAVRRGVPLRFKRLPAESPLLPPLQAMHGRRALVRTRLVVGTPTIALDKRWREPEHHFSKRRRGDFRTALRRAEQLGQVELTVEEPTPEQVGPLFEEVVAVEASGWKMRAGTALAASPRKRSFLLRLCEIAAEEKATRLAFLRIGGRAVAVQVAVEQQGRYSLFKIGFDEEFARCSPGNLLMLHTVRQAANRGLTAFDFLGAEEPWTAVWTEEVRSCLDVNVYPLSAWSPVAGADAVARRLGWWGLQRIRAARTGG
ncbi:Acetyltransferase involved in cellulose biosynthesis, CelD/BcsL family [Geodermatophilus africanus]|uniref:Acetyltransferase involved in cellulose biosynthesis, CelD/BcsL family n=1 Tax=Geodermatophilus africanus TaxID=1137993 RepID=A0A1H3QTE9_9ACTN|nr:GNAT family N-acetyltransferase [Geodermatophilus africanus]SDZ16278.1 Acetyltransferase involved in cellulose biosynthesis, CelD/BcsL family [Geodermatophilus africanus]